MIATTEHLPDWPPPTGEAIGIERAQTYIAWIKHHVRPLIEAGKAEMRHEYQYAEITTSSHPVARLARESTTAENRLKIGHIKGQLTPKGKAYIEVWITSDGRLELIAGSRMRGEHPRKW